MTVTIRQAGSDDFDECTRLLNVLSGFVGTAKTTINSGVFQEMIQGKRGLILVAEEGAGLLGMSTISFNLGLRYERTYCQLEELVVDPEARGKNVGGLLVEKAIQAAKEAGCNEFGLYLMKSTEHNQPFYEKYGFEKVGSEMRQRLNRPA